MGLRLRKSINLGGGFRINLSKSGVGYSWGTKGYRVTQTASGKTRQTYSIPGTGVSYVDERKSTRTRNHAHDNANRNRDYPQSLPTQHGQPQQDVQHSIESTNPESIRSAEFASITSAIKRTIMLNRWGTGLLICALLAFVQPYCLILPMLGIVLKIIAHKAGSVQLEYNFDPEKKEEYERRIGAWQILAEGEKEWQVIAETHNSNTKVHAGAARSLNRLPCKIEKGTPFYVRTNVETIQIKLKNETLLILPDKIFIIRGTKIGAENYQNVRITSSSVSFVESDAVPKDAQITGRTWLYVSKNGTPDQRYKNNKQFPICNYGVVTIRSESGMNVEMQVSNVQKCRDFDMLIR